MTPGIRDGVAFFKDPSVPLWSKLLGLLAIAYVVSPLDLAPDVIPIVGWLDDAGLVAAIAAYYVRRIGDYRERRELEASRLLPEA